MLCPKCKTENPDSVQYCRRCHSPLRYVCPACKHVQDHGGRCDSCGVDFLKYAMTLQMQLKDETDAARQKMKTRSGIVKQILLLPITGGFSLLKYFRERMRGE